MWIPRKCHTKTGGGLTWPMGCSLLTPKIVLSRTEPQWPTVVTGSLTHLWLASSPFLSHLSAPSWGFWISPQTNDLLSDFCLRVCFWGPNLRTVPHLQMKRGKPLEAKQLVYSPTRRGRAAFLNCQGLFQSHWTLLSPWGRKCFPAQIQQTPDGPLESVEHLAILALCPRPAVWTGTGSSKEGRRRSMSPRGLSHP